MKTDAATQEKVDELAGTNMVHDLMTMSINELKAASGCWAKMPEQEQEEIIERLERQVKSTVQEALHLISSGGFVRIPATFDSMTVKDGLKVQLSLGRTEKNRHALLDCQGGVVTIVLANASEFIEQPHGIRADPQQPDLIVESLIERAKGVQPPPDLDEV